MAAPKTSAKSGPLHTREIPSSGEALACIGMGTWQTFDVRGAEALAQRRQVLETFLAGGGQVIDSSPMYGRAQQVVGELLPKVEHAARAFVATKVWTTGKADGIEQMQDSIRKMGGRVDLMQVHNLLDWKTHLPILTAYKREGTIRYVGITHYRASAFDELEQIMKAHEIDFVQLPYSIGFREAERRLLPCARDTGTAVLVMRPFEGGDLFGRTAGRELPAFATRLGIRSWAQYFLKFLLGHPAVTCPIPATSKPRHMQDNLAAGVGPMPDAATRKQMVAYLGL